MHFMLSGKPSFYCHSLFIGRKCTVLYRINSTVRLNGVKLLKGLLYTLIILQHSQCNFKTGCQFLLLYQIFKDSALFILFALEIEGLVSYFKIKLVFLITYRKIINLLIKPFCFNNENCSTNY